MHLRALALLISALVVASALADGALLAASNQVSTSSIAVRSQGITANHLKPWQCAGVNVVTIVTGAGKFDGTGGNDLVLGSAGIDDIDAKGGDDCVVGAGGADKLDGGSGTDVCVGTAQTKTYAHCETRFP